MKRDVRQYNDLGRCLVTKKKMFDLVTARAVSKDMRRHKGTNHHPYHCPSCQFWHVGSSEIRRQIKTQPATPWRPLPIHHYQQEAA
jgi:hypothetical protein